MKSLCSADPGIVLNMRRKILDNMLLQDREVC